MAYEVIARKWRPQTFAEVVGQEAITQTLRNAVSQERVHHAYLFTGARGVGKTTTARILAKALNCAKGITTEPDNTCDSCREIAAGGSMDVLEIDAASHTGVDNIRDTIISSVGISPARDRYKVFIIDEVHQLSQAAFNALLKTLEEPPSRVVFVLATTELHKVPDTISSRCQVFEFRTIGLSKVQAKLSEIAAQLGVKATPAAIAAIARAGEGSMRDAQSALDQVIAFAGEQVDVADVTTALGIVGDEVLYDFFEAIARADAPTVLRLTTRLVDGGHDLRNFTKSMMRAARNLLVIRAVGFDSELVDTADSDSQRVSDLAREFTEAELVRAFTMLSELEQEIRQSADPRFQLEIGMVRLAELPRLRPLEDLIDRLTRLEAKLGAIAGAPPASGTPLKPAPPKEISSPRAPTPSSGRDAIAPTRMPPPPEPPPFDDEPFDMLPPPQVQPPTVKPPSKPVPATAEPAQVAVATGLDGAAAIDALKHGLEASNKMLLIGALESAAEMIIDGNRLAVRFDTSCGRQRATVVKRDVKVLIEELATRIVGRPIALEVTLADEPLGEAAAQVTTAPAQPASAEESERAAQDPIVKAMLETFRGEIVSVDKPS